VRSNLRRLHEAMEEAGLKPLPGEWWHFDDLEFLYTSIPVIRARDLAIVLPE
jgi:beta-N-acetylhexosaminidase/D-alanyl-D-alanine dipeptidase